MASSTPNNGKDLLQELMKAQSCPFCHEDNSERSWMMKRVHYLWKHTTEYVNTKKENERLLEQSLANLPDKEKTNRLRELSVFDFFVQKLCRHTNK